MINLVILFKLEQEVKDKVNPLHIGDKGTPTD